MSIRFTATFAAFVISFSVSSDTFAESEPTREEAINAVRKAVAFYSEQVSIEGGYLWRYSEDLAQREGESAATASMAWVQPPGTPAVGEAYLTAYERTKQPFLLKAAIQTARALVRGQLASGGWDYRIEFDPKKRSANAYRVDGLAAAKARNVSTLDDNTTQSAIRYLMNIDRALEFKNKEIHDAAQFALESVLGAQYPNGAWPQRFSGPPKPEEFPVIKANYPASWPKDWPGTNYMAFYTLNDNSLSDVMAILFEAGEIYGNSRYADAARRGGDFLILAQMPDPQPAWAQQYDAQMHPAWARKFEPPSVTGGESQGAIRILMEVYRQTGDRKYLEPIPRALSYLEKSKLPDGRMARFYELQTNRPLYFTKKYELVYSADDLPTHYGFITSNNLARIRAEYEKLLATDPAKLKPTRRAPKFEFSDSLAKEARQVIAAMDSRGAWIEAGKLSDSDPDRRVSRILSTQTLIKNLDTLGRFIASIK